MQGPRADPTGRVWFPANLSWTIVGFYLVLVLALFYASRTAFSTSSAVLSFLIAVLLAFLLRYLSTRYWMDSDHVGAFRLVGTRKVAFEDVRRIEFANLRDLGPVGFMGSWGYRGRMWSSVVGPFDSIHTASPGVMISAGPVPLFVSPKDPMGFARELSRRVRSTPEGALELDESAETAPPRF